MTASTRRGGLCFVLHGHMPYVRQAGRWPFGEEWLYEAMAETYAPLAQMLERLAAEGVSAGLTLSFTPILLEQLSDAYIQKNFAEYLEDRIRRAKSDQARFAREKNAALEFLALEHCQRFEKVRGYFADTCGGNLLERFRRLQDAGHIEIITSAATHAYLPLLGRDSSVHAQLEAGLRVTKSHFGRTPDGFWLPECAYRPGQTVELTRTESYYRPALDEFISSLGAQYFVADSHAVTGGEVGGGGKGRLYSLQQPAAPVPFPSSERTLCRPFVTRAGVSVFGRHWKAGEKVWSAQSGYPADPDYRDYYRRDALSGLPYRRGSDPKLRISSDGDCYRPEAARERAKVQADNFAEMIESELGRFQSDYNVRGVVTAAFDMELFGHGWHEGLLWLENVLRRIAHDQAADLLSLGAYMRQEPAVQAIEVPESSWGQGGRHDTWENRATEEMWTEIHAAELAMENLVATISQANDLETRYLRQAGRELFLLQASDWPFLISTGQAREYAEERFHGHLERFRRLARIMKEGHTSSSAALEELSRFETLDNCFARLDPHWFARRQPQPIHNLVPKFVGIG